MREHVLFSLSFICGLVIMGLAVMLVEDMIEAILKGLKKDLKPQEEKEKKNNLNNIIEFQKWAKKTYDYKIDFAKDYNNIKENKKNE